MRMNKKKKAVSEVSVEKFFFLAISDVADILSPPPRLRKADKRPFNPNSHFIISTRDSTNELFFWKISYK